MTDPAFRQRLREALDERLFPDWTANAACRPVSLGGTRLRSRDGNRPGIPWTKGYADADMTYKPSLDRYTWPQDVKDAIEVCASCPVRRECLRAAYEVEGTTIRMGFAPALVTDTDEVVRREITIELMHTGVWGGVPGRVREHYAAEPDREQRCTEWFETFAASEHFEVAPNLDAAGTIAV